MKDAKDILVLSDIFRQLHDYLPFMFLKEEFKLKKIQIQIEKSNIRLEFDNFLFV